MAWHPPSVLCVVTGGHIWTWDRDAWLRVNARAIMLHDPGKPFDGLVQHAGGPCVVCKRPWSPDARTFGEAALGPVPLAASVSAVMVVFCVWVMVFLDRWPWQLFQGVALLLNVWSVVFSVRLSTILAHPPSFSQPEHA